MTGGCEDKGAAAPQAEAGRHARGGATAGLLAARPHGAVHLSAPPPCSAHPRFCISSMPLDAFAACTAAAMVGPVFCCSEPMSTSEGLADIALQVWILASTFTLWICALILALKHESSWSTLRKASWRFGPLGCCVTCIGACLCR
jgi:hypothetical protein